MEQVKVFEHKQFGSIRTINRNNEIWFVGKDIADNLGYAKSRNAISEHVDDEDKTTALIQGSGLNPNYKTNVVIINKSGLYSLILSSKLPQAKAFKHWVTSEVLPSLEKHGMYASDELINNPDLLIQVATKLKEERAAKEAALKQLEEAKPKVEFYETIQAAETSIDMNATAKLIKQKSDIKFVGRNQLFDILRKQQVLRANNEPYQAFVNQGYFELIPITYNLPSGQTCIKNKTLVTPRGVEFCIKQVKKYLNK